MLILPAIDLRGGRCVRLRQGDYSRETVFDEDPVAVARRFEDAGAVWLHMVDLDGAREGEPKNLDKVAAVAEAVGMNVELGGGIRTTGAVEKVLGLGVARVIVGTRAVREPDWLAEVATRLPGRVALGLDARSGHVAVEGWQGETGRTAADVLVQAEALPLAAVIYTDIAKDGMMSGPNVEAATQLAKVSPFPVIASGGVTTVEDVRRLKAAGTIYGAIIGRALYEGMIDLEEAIAVAGDQSAG
ncbi:MAG TPA: 1-(5-phosphoribosyl)-5-[(5-phosphoribosylamino)methylideneamino]imidazole-4-carboxamide isomerase [Phycisphaerae bacterium]|nr:1-(5-phosphoribosyl)-5-[(5-phosphoribosylamino)methylideneamino]imidazole-4-carboxamide isomerase [Phycisphaerae bacterium]